MPVFQYVEIYDAFCDFGACGGTTSLASIGIYGNTRYLTSAHLLRSTTSKRFYHYAISLGIDTDIAFYY